MIRIEMISPVFFHLHKTKENLFVIESQSNRSSKQNPFKLNLEIFFSLSKFFGIVIFRPWNSSSSHFFIFIPPPPLPPLHPPTPPHTVFIFFLPLNMFSPLFPPIGCCEKDRFLVVVSVPKADLRASRRKVSAGVLE